MLCFAFNAFLSFFSKFASPFFLDLCIVFVAIAGCPCLPQYFFYYVLVCLFFSVYSQYTILILNLSKGHPKWALIIYGLGKGGGWGGNKELRVQELPTKCSSYF